VNILTLIGNLTRDVEVRRTQNGTCVAKINVAVNRTYAKDGQKETDFFQVTVFGKQAESVERYLSKGSKVGINGRIQNNNYEKDEQTVYQDTIIADRVEFLGGGARNENDVVAGGYNAPAY
jgi:single-strand DNA-binding protein